MGWKCPYCQKDTLDKNARDQIRKLSDEQGLQEEWCNPGGRQLIFPWGSVQFTDCCYHCDLLTLKERIKRK